MNWNDIGNNIWSLVSAVGGISVIVVGLSVWIGKILASRFNEKFRLASEQEIKLLESQHAKEMSEIQFEHDRKLEEQKQKLQYEFDAQRQALHIDAAQNLRFLEKQFDLYLTLWDNLQELLFTGEKLWEEASSDNMVLFTEAYHKARLIAEKVSLVMDSRNYRRLREMLATFEYFRVGKRSLIELRTGNSVRLAYKEYLGESDNEILIEEDIRHQIHFNAFHRDTYQNLMENIRQELQTKLAGNPLADTLRANVRDMYR